MEYLNKINNKCDILGIDISENNKKLKSHGLWQKGSFGREKDSSQKYMFINIRKKYLHLRH